MLFIDSKYRKRVKEYVKGGKQNQWSGSATELQEYLKGEREELLWDSLLLVDCTTLRGSFSELRVKRNDIMHAHNINYNEYIDTKRLFERTNKELETAMERIAEGALVPDNYSEQIKEAMSYMSSYAEEIAADLFKEKYQ